MSMLGINYTGRTEKITGIKIALNVLILSFFAVNLSYRFLSVFNHSYFIGALYIFLAVLSFFIILFPKLLTKYLFFFGFSLIFFGYRAYDIQSQVFETILTFVCFTLFTVNLRNRSALKLNPPLTLMILCYVCLAMCSIILLPLGHILKDFSVLGFKSFALQFANTKPETFYYSLGGVNRLSLYCILAFQLAKTDNTHSVFKLLYSGIFTGAVASSLLGIFEYYNIISLSWYRWATPTPGVLHSLFLNRGWFAEFILITFPFVLIGVISRTNSFKWKTLCSGSLIICEVALLLAGARTGWLVYPVALFICWFFVVSFKKGEFKPLLFKRSNLIKAAMLMPITIVISIVLVFLAFNSISDTSSTTTIEKGIKKNTKNPNTYLTDRASLLLKPSRGGRIYTWSEGFNVGREKPFFGMGYESFKWHAHILENIKKSYFHRFRYYNKIIVKNIHDTPHNIYLQLFISNGIIGLLLWLLIIGYAMTILIVDLKKNRRLLNIPVFISIISFHLYGIFQSMQYVPMIWMLIFLNLGYALTLNNMLLPKKFQNLLSLAIKIIIILVLIGSIIYFTGAGSKKLAEKYGMQKSGHQASQQASWWPQKYTSGIYSVGSRRVKSGKLIFSKWCWTTKEAQVSLTAASDILRLRIKADKLNSSLPEGLKLNLFLNDQLLDSVHFINGGSKTLSYYIPDIKNTDIILKLQVNRTFKPIRLESSVYLKPQYNIGIFYGGYVV